MISTENADVGSPPGGPQGIEPKPPIKPQAGGLFEWFYRARTLAEARSVLRSTPPLEARRLLYARRALELADRAFDPVDPLRAGSGVALSLSLYREAAYWALLAQDEILSASNLQEAFSKTDPALLSLVAGGEEPLKQVRTALVEKDFVGTFEDPDLRQQQDAAVVRDFVHALVALRLEPEARVGRILLQRWMRSLVGCFTLVALLVGGVYVVRQLGQGPDLAAGRPWQASSRHAGCDLQRHMCGPTPVKIFFHTDEEDQPWVQFDLGPHTRFSHVELVNRSDSGIDRAFPVVIESSNDAKKWKELARRDTSYSTWRADFAPTTARYVRARVLKRTWFHLEGFKVYAR
jgi:hypothetical protein